MQAHDILLVTEYSSAAFFVTEQQNFIFAYGYTSVPALWIILWMNHVSKCAIYFL